MTDQQNSEGDVNVKVRLLRNEVVDSFWRYRKETDLALPAIQCFVIFGFVGICAACGIAFKALLLPSILPYFGLALACFMLFAVPIFAVKIYLWSERTGYHFDTIAFYRDEAEYTISARGIDVRGTELDRHYPWTELKQVYETPYVFIVVIEMKKLVEKFTNEKELLILPKRYFADPEQSLQVRKFLRAGITGYLIMKK